MRRARETQKEMRQSLNRRDGLQGKKREREREREEQGDR